MPITTECPSCHIPISVPDSAAGSRIRCTSCGAEVEIPVAVGAGVGGAPNYSTSAASGSATGAATPDWQRSASSASHAALGKTREAMTDAAAAFKILIKNPTQGISQAFHQLGPQKALQVGIVCAAIFILSYLLCMHQFFSFIGSMMGSDARVSVPASFYLKGFFFALIPLAAMFGAMAASRMVAKGSGSWQADAFVTGIAIIPVAFVMLVIGILGLEHYDFISILAMFAMCILILTLFHGFKDLAGLAPGAATLAVPITLLVTMFVCRMLASAMIPTPPTPTYPTFPM
jgi:hypothetical protein